MISFELNRFNQVKGRRSMSLKVDQVIDRRQKFVTKSNSVLFFKICYKGVYTYISLVCVKDLYVTIFFSHMDLVVRWWRWHLGGG